MKCCKKCNNDITCDSCDILVSGNKQFNANLTFLKQKRSKQLGHMLPYYQEEHDLFIIRG